jgi:hypothetical protein
VDSKNVRYKRYNLRFVFLYLKLNHFLNHVILGWLNLFKSLTFVPLFNVREAFYQIKLDKPVDIRIVTSRPLPFLLSIILSLIYYLQTLFSLI